MKAPRFFTGLALLFWGWQVHTLLTAICLAGILESAYLIKSRFEFRPSDFNKIVDISTVLLAGTIVIALTIEVQTAILILLKWLPLVFFPVIAAQVFSTKGKIDIQSFFLVARKKVKLRRYESREIDVSFLYSLFCILSAGSANTKGYFFYYLICLFFIWALWQIRSRRVPFFLWAICISFVIISGYAGQAGIRLASMKINQWIMEYYASYYNADPFKTSTALGEIGKLKLSDKIVLRVSFQDYIPGKTYLLHNATFNKFAVSTWFVRSRFEPVEPAGDKTFWQINPSVKTTGKMTIYFRLIRQRAVLSLPSGVITLSGMKAGICEKNTMQSVRIENGPSLIKSIVSYTDKVSYDAKPYEHDLLIPAKERPGIAKIVSELALENKSEQAILKIVTSYFLTKYTYSLHLKGKGKYATPLQNFLNHTKAGHCEFFATATVLILRQANIPARYATGYIAHEYSRMENQLIVRQRDAHAWVRVFTNGQWENFDTTPPSFLQIDSQKIKSSLTADLFSFLGFKLSQLRYETGADLMDQYGFWLILPLLLILFFRLRKSNKIKRIKMPGKIPGDKNLKNNKISFYLIEDMLAKKGFERYPYETYSLWLERIGHHFGSKGIKDHLQTLLRRHNRLRFSKPGLTIDEKRKLDSDIKSILIILSTES